MGLTSVIRRATRHLALATLAALTAVVVVVGLVSGHAGYIDLVITPPIVEPGDEITIQGQALWTELPITVDLVHQDGGRRVIASGMTEPDGSLYMTAQLPADIPDGPYQVIVANPYGETSHGSVIVRSSYPTLPIAIGVVVAVVVVLAVLRMARTRRPASGSSAAEES